MRPYTPLARNRSVLVRLLLGACLAAGLAISTIQAQIPGRNVNMVSGTKLPDGDPFLQRQNEPSIAASTRNPLHLLGGSNDYRTVDVPGMCLEYGPDPTNPNRQICVKNEEVTGDAWIGLFKSTDGGQRWTSGLLPGYPQDNSPAGLASPLRAKPGVPGSGYQAGADAVVRAGTHGMIYYSGLAFDRADNGKSGVFLARFIDNNNQEAGDPVAYLGTTMVAQSTGAKFLDKPWMAVDVPRGNSAFCTISEDNILPTLQNGRRRRHGYDRHEKGNKGNGKSKGNGGASAPGVQRIPAGAIYVAYSSISGDATTLRSEILISRSMDCGSTWSAPIKVSRAEDAVNQGSSLTIDPKTGAVYISWRRFDNDLTDNVDLDAIMVARLPLGATKVDAPNQAHKFPKPTRKVGRQLHRLFEHRENRFKEKGKPAEVTENLDQFDLGTTGYNFRTNAYPTMAADGTGRIYVAWTQRGYSANSGVADGARIVIATTKDGKTFTAPEAVDDHATPGRGHQLMPSMAFAGGKLMVVFYDLRDSKAGTHNRIASDFNTDTGLRQTIDIRSAMASPGDHPVFPPSVKVSDYLMGFNPETDEIEELQVNPPNLPMFKQGTVPFIGDYIDVAAAPAFIPGKNGKWDFNTANTGEIPLFHAAWTDNRDVRPPKNGEWWNYTPAKMSPDQMAGASVYDPSQTTLQCVDGVGNPGSRNQNIYSARITGGLLAGSPGNAKPLSTQLQRGFVVFAQNTTKETKSYRMTIMAQPVGGRASFDQFPLPPYTTASPKPETAIEMIVPPLSTASRTVYVTSSDPDAQLTVDVSELTDLRLLASPALYPTAPEKTGGLEARVILNPDIENPDIENPDIENPDIENPDIENVEVYNPDIENPDIENPDIENPDIENPDIENPDIENPDIENPDIENVRVANPDIENPDIENPDIENPDIENPDIENPDIENPDIENGAIADITWKVTNDGNTTASFNVNLFLAQQTLPTGVKTQLVLLKTYRTPVTQANKCQLGFQTRNILLANIRNPILVPPGGGTSNANDPAETNATLWLAPGEEGRIVLRVIDEDTSNNVPVTKPNGDVEYIDPSLLPTEDVSPVVQQQAVNSDSAATGVTEPPVVPPPAPPATNDVAWTSPGLPVRINVLNNDAALLGSTKVLSVHQGGLAQNMGGAANELVYMPTTGLVYAGSGRSIGVIDPVTNHLVGRIPTNPNDGVATYGVASPKSGLLFFRMGNSGQPGASLYGFDARPGATLNQVFPIAPAYEAALDALGDAHVFTLDTTGKVVFYVAGTSTQQGVTAINADPSSPTAGAILWGPIPLPANGKAWQIAQNPVTGKLYVASLNAGTGTPPGGGVYMINPAAPTAPVKITGADQSISVAINPATNIIFTAGVTGNYRLNAIDGATDTLIGQSPVVTSGGIRTNNAEDRLVVHHATGRVYLRGPNHVFIFDGLKGSPAFNSVVATLGAGPDFGNTDLVVDQDTGVIAMAGNFVFSIAVIDATTDAITWLPALKRAAGDFAVDPVTHRLFLADFLNTVHTYSALTPATVALTASLEVAPETAHVVVNAATHRAYGASSGIGSTISVLSGAGVVGPVANLSPEAGRWGFGGQFGSNFYFTNSASDVASAQSRPGSLVQINGATDTAVALVPTVGQPFGFGVNAAASQLIVAGLNGVSPTGATEAGKIRVHDALNPGVGVDADITGVPANNATSIAFGRHVVTNPNTGNTYVMITGGSPRSVLYLPQTALPTAPVAVALDLTTMPGVTVDDRVEVIRVNAAQNIIYLGLSNSLTNAYQVLALDGTSHTLVGSFIGGGHSRLHTPSWIAMNAAGDRVYVVNYNTDKVSMLTKLLSPISETTLPEGPSSTAFNNTLNRLYVGSLDAKSVTAIDGTTLAVLSTVKLPLHASFLYPSESDNRLYTAGGNSPDESGFMVLNDVSGQLGAPVTVTNATASGGATVTVDTDSSVTYTPAPGFSGQDTFTYTAHTVAGDSTGTVLVNVIPVAGSPVAFSDAYSTPVGVTLNVGGRGVLANDAVSSTATAILGFSPGAGLTLNPNGSFSYVPTGPGTVKFTYIAMDGGYSNSATVTINVVQPSNPLMVVNTNDSGAGSLRSAITYANSTPAADTITFAIPAGPMGPPFVIAPVTQLPALNSGITIDGLSQPGTSAGVPNVVISGASMPLDSNGLTVNGSANVIRGLVINNFAPSANFIGGSAILLNGTNNVVEGNFLGTAVNGSSPAGVRNYSGVKVSGNANRIGGANMGLRNVISGNSQGVWITGGTGNVIAFNHIGTNFAGNAVVPAIPGPTSHGNEFGVLVDAGTGAAIGQSGSLSNVISGNLTGVQLRGGSGTQIVSNNIGLDAVGTSAIPNGDGISAYFVVSNTTIGGAAVSDMNQIAGNTAWGINLDTANVTNTRVFNNKIGLNAVNGASANLMGGIRNAGAAGTIIGAPGRTNIISGNNGPSGYGILVTANTNGATIQSNRIGTDPSGTFAIPNGPAGGDNAAIFVDQGSSNVLIGGSISGNEGNLISGNTAYGIKLWGSNNQVKGNLIGTNLSGNSALPNGKYGVHVEIGSNNVIGAAGAFRNVVSGNTLSGIVVSGSGPFAGATGTQVVGNVVGVGADLVSLVANGGAGVDLREATSSTVTDNTIRGNAGAGVRVVQGTTGNLIASNSIYGNGGLGIDINDDGITPNDLGDGDTGSNGLQNFPVLTSAVNNGGSTDIGVDLASFSSGNFMIRFYANTTCDASGYGEGQTMVGVASVPYPGTGVIIATAVPVGQYLTATATDGSGNTSEFSACRIVAAGAPPAAITSAEPQPVGAMVSGVGQYLTIHGTNLPASQPSHVVFTQGANTYSSPYVWQFSATRIITALPAGLVAGPATVVVSNGTVSTPPFNLALSTTPGAPILHTVYGGTCLSGGTSQPPISSTSSGASVIVDATGIDFGTSLTFVWTPVSGGAAQTTPGGSACGGPSGRVHIDSTVPAFAPGTNVRLEIRQSTPGGTSNVSNPIFLTMMGAISSVSPVGPSANQMASFYGAGLQIVDPFNRQRAFFTQGPNTTEGFVFYGDTSRWSVRLPNGLAPGAATVYFATPAGVPLTPAFNMTISATPAAPVLTAVAANCAGTGYLASVSSGTTIWVVADGVDTTGSTVVFTPTSPAGAPIEVAGGSACGGNGSSRTSIPVTVPSFLTFSNTTVNVQIKQQVGFNTSPLSAPYSMTVTSSQSLVGPAGDVTGAPFGPLYCAAGTSAVGFTVHTGQPYALTSADLRCSNGSTTPKFGGGTIPDTAVACNPGDVMVGMFGTIGQPFATTNMPTSVAPRCQAASLTGPITQPQGPLPGGGTAFGPIDCPAGKRVVGVSGGQGSVVDHIYLVCGTP